MSMGMSDEDQNILDNSSEMNIEGRPSYVPKESQESVELKKNSSFRDVVAGREAPKFYVDNDTNALGFDTTSQYETRQDVAKRLLHDADTLMRERANDRGDMARVIDDYSALRALDRHDFPQDSMVQGSLDALVEGLDSEEFKKLDEQSQETYKRGARYFQKLVASDDHAKGGLKGLGRRELESIAEGADKYSQTLKQKIDQEQNASV